MEGVIFYLREILDTLPEIGLEITDFRAVGGGSKSDAWVQMSVCGPCWLIIYAR
jgi:sugar (pentulose or hexulose) kinase